MARSELFKQLKRTLEAFETPIDRRKFLQASLTGSAVLAGALYPNPKRLFARALPARGSGRVAVIGAGFAGLSAAYRFRKLGIESAVFEAGTRPGGRVLTRKGFHQGMFCEMGGELIDRNHYSLLGMARELGVEVEEFPAESRGTEESLFYVDGGIYTECELGRAAAPLVERVRRDRVEIFGTVEGEVLDCRSAGKYPNAARFDRMTLAEYLDSLTGVDDWVKRLVGRAYVTEFGLELEEQSALNLHLLVDTDLSDGEFALFGESDESLRVKGGNSNLVEKLAEAVFPAGGEIRYGHRLVAIEEIGTKVRLFFQGPGGATLEYDADRVVLAVPFSVLRSVEFRSPLSPRTATAIRRMAYAAHAKSMIGTRDRFWRKKSRGLPRSNGSWMNDLPSQAYWETSRGQAGAGGVLTNFRGGDAGRSEMAWTGSAESVVGGFLAPYSERERARLAGTMLEAKASIVWSDSPFAMGSYFCPRPGDNTEIVGAAETSEWGGKLQFAGEHTSANFGYMDAAVESAFRAVDRIAAGAPGLTRTF